MKIQIRQEVFETNSSSTHVLCHVKKDNYNAWKAGELYYYPSDVYDKNGFINAKEARDKKFFIKSEYNIKEYDEDDDFNFFFLDELIKKGWPIFGFYPLSYKEFKKLYPEYDELDSDGYYFQKKGEGTHIAFETWISEAYGE